MPGANGLCRDAKAGRGRMPLTPGCFEGLPSAQSEGSLLVQQCGLQLGHTNMSVLVRTRFWWKEDSSRTLRIPANEQPCKHLSSRLLVTSLQQFLSTESIFNL